MLKSKKRRIFVIVEITELTVEIKLNDSLFFGLKVWKSIAFIKSFYWYNFVIPKKISILA